MPIHFSQRRDAAHAAERFSARHLLLVMLLTSASLLATPGVLPAQFMDALASREMRREAIAAIPFPKLDEAVKNQVWQVVNQPTMYRRLPVRTIDCDPELYVFLVRNPEVVVNMWQLIGITQVRCKRIGPYSYEGSDGAGTVTNVDLVYGTQQQHLFLADGHYEGPLLKRMTRGKCVLLLTSKYGEGPDQRPKVTSQLDLFLQLENVGAEFVAKTLQPLVGKVADANFVESVNFLSQVSRAAEKKGDNVQVLGNRLTNVEPAVRDEFVQIALNVHRRSLAQPAAVVDPLPEPGLLSVTMEEPLLETEASATPRLAPPALRVRR